MDSGDATEGLGPGGALARSALSRAEEAFLRAGLAALADTTDSNWYQIGLAPSPIREHRAELYRRIAGLARELLDTSAVDNIFFMHKSPGLRLRCESDSAGLSRLVRDEVVRWQHDGLVERIEPGLYEPEHRLFGGPVSMRHVHRVFTVDSLAWLDFHAGNRSDTAPDWALSLAMVQALFDGLDIAGWEDIDVWDRIRVKTGRQLPIGARELAGFAGVSTDIRASWHSPDALRRLLGSAGCRIADEHRAAVMPIAKQWREGYFATDSAYLGPRSVAAFVIIFHWNRAGLSMVRQTLLAEVLATREAASR